MQSQGITNVLLDSPWLVEQPIVIACFHDELSDGEAAFAILNLLFIYLPLVDHVMPRAYTPENLKLNSRNYHFLYCWCEYKSTRRQRFSSVIPCEIKALKSFILKAKANSTQCNTCYRLLDCSTMTATQQKRWPVW